MKTVITCLVAGIWLLVSSCNNGKDTYDRRQGWERDRQKKSEIEQAVNDGRIVTVGMVVLDSGDTLYQYAIKDK